ncbi:baseplate hub [Pelagibacter phage HTVC008M]|jgi:hypothetical protein|uniref:baseplate hub n=1 Tax=Pelagibacter phage HTVC008M TaxID=1283076 RepID=UPI0002B28C05|nr:baseplate hub [Pelagibacter phage HTVC008M]AGE60357.1 baseplate hub subunit [Pelagibacter phage HTVC008M]
MALPKLNTQQYELTIPSSDEKIKFRPFLVKEEKILLQGQEGGDDEMINALKQIVSNCTFNKVDINKLPSFDIEYIFLQIRAKSVGEKIKLNVPFPGDPDTKVPATVDLTTIQVEMDDKHVNKVQLNDNVSVIMSYPTLSTYAGKNLKDISADDAIGLVSDCVYQIIDGVETHEAVDLKKEEIDDFVNNLTQEQFAKIQDFFVTMPRLKHTVNLTHPKTKKKGKVVLEGLQSFF